MAMLDLDRLLAYSIPDVAHVCDPPAAILYALGVGAGLADFDESDFLYEQRLRVLPTQALVLGTACFWPMDQATGLDWRQILHGEQTLDLHRPLAPMDRLTGHTAIDAIADKGLGKPALIRATRRLTAADGALVATMTETWVVRGAGGFGGERTLPDILPVDEPSGPPDRTMTLPGSPQQAALYRLSGDRNPLHIDAATARAAGFERPILHGLCTMGMVARAIIHLCCDGDPARLNGLRQRFCAPVYPGEALSIRLWRTQTGCRFDAATADGRLVLDRGDARFDPG